MRGREGRRGKEGEEREKEKDTERERPTSSLISKGSADHCTIFFLLTTALLPTPTTLSEIWLLITKRLLH